MYGSCASFVFRFVLPKSRKKKGGGEERKMEDKEQEEEKHVKTEGEIINKVQELRKGGWILLKESRLLESWKDEFYKLNCINKIIKVLRWLSNGSIICQPCKTWRYFQIRWQTSINHTAPKTSSCHYNGTVVSDHVTRYTTNRGSNNHHF